MNKFKYAFGGCLAAMFFLACTSTQVGLKENWIDERDVIALISVPMSEWMVKAGRPTLVEISGDTAIYYYNYRPTMYAAAVYDSTSFFKTWGRAAEVKPGLANATEVWGSRKNTMQIKVLNDKVISATISNGPDKKTLIRDLNGNLIIDQTSGYNANISEEQKINSSSKDYDNAFNSLSGKYTWPQKQNVPNASVSNVIPVKEPANEAPVAEVVNSAPEAVATEVAVPVTEAAEPAAEEVAPPAEATNPQETVAPAAE